LHALGASDNVSIGVGAALAVAEWFAWGIWRARAMK
jgi:hypothetical protein